MSTTNIVILIAIGAYLLTMIAIGAICLFALMRIKGVGRT